MIILKSILYSIYFLKLALKNYIPVIVYLISSQLIIIKIQNVLLILIFFVGYLLISAPLVVNIFRNIIANDHLFNSYAYFFEKTYTKLFIKKLIYLIVSIVTIYVVHIIVLSPFFPSDISKMTALLYILFMYMIYIYTRIMFILPSASINISRGLRDSYLLTKNKSFKIYFLYIAIIVPYLFLNLSISSFIEKLGYNYIFIFIMIIFQVFFTIVSNALIAYLYRDLAGVPAHGHS